MSEKKAIINYLQIILLIIWFSLVVLKGISLIHVSWWVVYTPLILVFFGSYSADNGYKL